MKFGVGIIEESKKFNKYPEYTPKVYYVDQLEKYSVVEKMNVKDASSDFQKHIKNPLWSKKPLRNSDFKNESRFKMLKNYYKNPEDIFFLDKIWEIVKKVGMEDIRGENFGYDDNKILKCIDL